MIPRTPEAGIYRYSNAIEWVMSKPILDNLFGSKTRVKILKFLFRNYPDTFTLYQLSNHTQEAPHLIKKEVEMMEDIGLVKRK
ncbi:MAG: archaellum operon transcriptional activator EarA family protein [Candidatus Yanofskybacteria bacterium]|nr:archaellum operon transcriptional activator EarA family protein [Candidatus Yanofskybacteria bacterium]